jgi:alkylation response protein AidB-like acyl-CoA dehydrogenase
MSDCEYDLTLDDEQLEIRDAAHKFAAEVLRPAGIELDRMSAEAMVASGSPFYDVLRQAAELGYTRLGGPAELGAVALKPVTHHLVWEELAWGNVGLAGAISLSSAHVPAALASGNPALIEEFAAPFYACGDGSICGCWAVTEPDHGSDTLDAMRPELRVKATGQLVARPDGDDWILNGQKSAWVSNGPIATHALINPHLEPDSTLDRGGVCVVPLDLPGISQGPAIEKHGVRTLPQGALFFDDVRIPGRYMVFGADAYSFFLESQLGAFNAGVGCLVTGLARAAYDCALAYCKERVQGGRPIFEHQSVRARLFRMFSLVRASRTLSRGVFVYNMTRLGRGEPAQLHHSIASKVFCTEAALEVATLGVQLHGGTGLTPDTPAEMFLRDAMAFTIADGENALLSQIGASYL